MAPVTASEPGPSLPAEGLGAATDARWVLDARARLIDAARFIEGGSPWTFARVAPSLRPPLMSLAAAGTNGVAATEVWVPGIDELVRRGLVHPRPAPRPGPHDVEVIVPAYGRPEALERCMQSLAGLRVIVVDDGTPDDEIVRSVAERYGARCLRLTKNSGPAAARNAGIEASDAPLLALLDSDCEAAPGWLDHLVPFFDDPRVAMVAPRVLPRISIVGAGTLARFESTASALDMGAGPALVRPGARLGFLPSAALVVRRASIPVVAFDPRLAVGEDVDLVWRLADAGWHVRYAPSAQVTHELRSSWMSWWWRRLEYGTSAGALEERHPGRLVPLHASPWNVAAWALLAAGRPVLASFTLAGASVQLSRSVADTGIRPTTAASLVARGFLSDGVALGRAMRCEYWPLGVAALVTVPRSRVAHVGAALLLAPLIAEWFREPRALDLFRFVGLRLVSDSAYGTGVLISALRDRQPGVVRPRFRPVRLARRLSSGPV